MKNNKEQVNFRPEKNLLDEVKRWFQVDNVIFFEKEKQREVILNPGVRTEYFRKSYPVRGEIVLHKINYIPDLPCNCRGRIIAVTALQPKDRRGKAKGPIKAKPITKYWELFESAYGGARFWVSPTEYIYESNRKNRKKGKRLQGEVGPSPSRIGDDEANKQILRQFKGRDFTKNDLASRDKSKSRNFRKRN